MVFEVVERPFFAEVVAALEHFAVGVVTVVFVAGHQSVGLAVFDHDVVAVGETAQFFAVASVNGGQIAVSVVVVAHQFLAVEGDGGEADMAAVTVELCGQLENAAAGIDFGKQQPCAAVGGSDLVEVV